MKIQTKLLLLPILGVMSLGMVGCNGGSKSDYVPFEGDPTQLTAKISFWHTMGQENQKTLNRMIEQFNEKYPNITIEHAAQGGYDDIKDKISAAIPAGTTPTMAYCYPDHVAEYMSAGAIEEMSGYTTDKIIGFGKEEWDSKGGSEDFISSFWDEGKSYGEEYGIKDGLYSVPFSKSTEVLFYNATVFEAYGWKVPTTWAEMEALFPQMIAAKPDLKACLGYDSDANMLITRFEQENIPYTSAEGEDHFLFNNDAAKAEVTKLKSWYDNHYLITQGSSANNEYTSNMFVAQDILMSIGSTGGTGYNYASNFEVGVAAVPGGTKNDHIISQGPSICFFARATQQEKYAAWLFYKWITNTDNSAIYAKLTGYSPVRESSFKCKIFTDYIDDMTKKGKDALIQKTLGYNQTLMNRFYVSPAFKGSSTARKEMDGILANVFLGTKTVEQAFSDALTNCLFAG